MYALTSPMLFVETPEEAIRNLTLALRIQNALLTEIVHTTDNEEWYAAIDITEQALGSVSVYLDQLGFNYPAENDDSSE